MSRNIKIAVDVGPLKTGDKVRGIGVYTKELLNALKIDGVDVFHTDLEKYDLVHLTRFHPFFVSLPFNKPNNVKLISTIYDLIPLIYPKNYPPGMKGKMAWEINKFLIRHEADAVITISETSKKDICRFTGINPSKVHVIYLAPRSIFKPMTNSQSLTAIQNKYSLPRPFALYVGDINYNKNIPILIKACKIVGIKLVIVGKQAAHVSELDLNHTELKHLKGVDWDGVISVGFVSDEILVELYNLASVYVQPSLYEGFGLPLLEAQACGVPVVAAKTQALVEIAEESALFANPKSANDFADKIKKIINDKKLKEDLIKKGILNANKYSWAKIAEETKKVYKSLIK